MIIINQGPFFFYDLAKSKLKVFDTGYLGLRFSSYFPVKRPARSPKLYKDFQYYTDITVTRRQLMMFIIY